MLLFVFLVKLSLATALTVRTRQYVTNFEDMTPFNFTHQIGIHRGLQWHHLYAHRLNSSKGAPTHSTPGPACAVGLFDNGTPTLSSVYPGSSVVFFDLSSFSWACIPSDSSHPGLRPETPTDCHLTVSAWEKTRPGREPSTVAQHYSPAGEKAKGCNIKMSTVNSAVYFRACERVEFDVRSLSGEEVVLLLGEVRYQTYNISSWGRNGINMVIHENGPYGIA